MSSDRWIETPPSKTYCEDWRRITAAPQGGLGSNLRLTLELRSEATKGQIPRRGLIIVNGSFMAIALDRPRPLPALPSGVHNIKFM